MIFKIALVLLVSFISFDVRAGNDIERLKPKEIAKYIESTKGKKRIIMIYASWCPICVQKMPHIIELERANKGSVIAVSVDENERHLSRYIKKLGDIPFRVILNKGSERKLAKALEEFGVREWEGVPEIILLDKENNVLGQGNYALDYIAAFFLGE